MKKLRTIPFIFALFLIPLVCLSQEQNENLNINLPSKKFPVKLGLKVSPAICWMNPYTKGYSYDGIRMGGIIGFVSDIYFAERYAITTGFNFSMLGGKLTYADSVMKPGTGTILNGQVYRAYNFIYFEIPLMIKMQTRNFGRFSFFGQIGFGTGFRIKATAKENFVPDKGDSFEQNYDLNGATTLMREAILLDLGFEYHFDQSSRMFFGIGYSNALNNVLTGTNYKSKLNEKSSLNYAVINLGFLF